MPEIVVKAAKDRDLFLIWSTVVDNAIWVGDRASLLVELRTQRHDSWNPPEARIARADVKGSSAFTPIGRCDWDDEALEVREGSPRDGWYRIRRERLADYAEALLDDDDEAAVALLECWEPFDEAGRAVGEGER